VSRGEGWRRLLPQKLTWVLDAKEKAKLKKLADIIDASQKRQEFLRKNYKTLLEAGVDRKEINAVLKTLMDVEDAARAYGNTIQAWTPSHPRPAHQVTITFDFDAYEKGKSTLRRLAQAAVDGFNAGWPVGLASGAGGGVRPVAKATQEAAEAIAKLGTRSKQTVVLMETAQGRAIISSGGTKLSSAQKALARRKGFLIAEDLAGFHGELTGIITAGQKGLVPTVGFTNNRMCIHCFEELSRIARQGGYKLRLSADGRHFRFIKP